VRQTMISKNREGGKGLDCRRNLWEGIYVLTVEIGNRGATGIKLESIIRETENDVEKGIHQARNRPFEKRETHSTYSMRPGTSGGRRWVIQMFLLCGRQISTNKEPWEPGRTLSNSLSRSCCNGNFPILPLPDRSRIHDD
jgi:hypothetical protein